MTAAEDVIGENAISGGFPLIGGSLGDQPNHSGIVVAQFSCQIQTARAASTLRRAPQCGWMDSLT